MNDWFDAEQRIERAQEFFEARQWSEALAEIEAALETNPSNAQWHAQRGFVLDQLEQFREAIEAYKEALDLGGEDIEVSTALGIDLIRIGRFAGAINLFERLAAAEPDYEPAYCHRILAYAELGDHDRAEEMFFLAQQIEERCPQCFANIAASLASRGQYQQAIACWDRALEIDPEFGGIRVRIARAHRAQGNLTRAREQYLAELRADPGDTELLFELAELLAEAGDVQASIAKFRQIVELDPEHLPARLTLAELLAITGQPKQALEILEDTAAQEESVPALLDLKLGEVYLLLERFHEAAEKLERVLAQDPNNEAALLAMGGCLLRQRRPADAADHFRRVLAQEEASPHAHHNLAVCLFVQGQHENALTHFLRAVELDPRSVMALHKAALASIRLARWDQAADLVRRALEVAPDSAALARLSKRLRWLRVRHSLGRLFWPIGRFFRK